MRSLMTANDVMERSSSNHAITELVREVVGFKSALEFEASKPDGTPRKLIDIGRMTKLGWVPRVDLREGVRLAYEEFKSMD